MSEPKQITIVKDEDGSVKIQLDKGYLGAGRKYGHMDRKAIVEFVAGFVELGKEYILTFRQKKN